MSKLRFDILKKYGRSDCWGWELVHQNGNILARGGDYTRKSDVKRAIRRFKDLNLGKADVREVQLGKSYH